MAQGDLGCTDWCFLYRRSSGLRATEAARGPKDGVYTSLVLEAGEECMMWVETASYGGVKK